MKIKLAIFLFIGITVSCSKDKFSDVPMLTLKEVSGDYVPLGDYGVQFTIEYTDAEGDIAGVPLFMQKISSSSPCADGNRVPSFLDSLSFKIPDDVPETSNQKGNIIITVQDQYLARIACSPADTIEQAVYKFWFRDRAGHPSDTITSPPITIEKTF
ncbi:MAG TPA: hypothetical protein VFV68_16750 [Agriterribacter sp.]|nr:hypothetical protein [Agriterribacter sp.]